MADLQTSGNEQPSPPVDAEDAAWASINTSLPVERLIAFCREDIERLFRINPMYEFEAWTPSEGGSISFKARNLSNDQTIETELKIAPQENGVRVEYLSGLKRSTEFRVESAPQGSKLTVIEEYRELEASERDARMDEVDKSLVPWANYLQEYMVKWKRWGWLPPWRWYMRKVWQPMTPSSRRISYMIIWIMFAELLAFLLVFLVFWLEMDKYFGEM